MLRYYASVFLLWPPVGFGNQYLLRLNPVVGAQVNIELVRAVHPLVHHIIHSQLGLFAWLECRRTDDGAGRSAALHDFYHRFTIDVQGLAADIF